MIVALTGGMGCGKSLALQYFGELGWKTLSADAVNRGIYDGNVKFKENLQKHWGARVIGTDGAIDRRIVADIVFADPRELEWLNKLLHPMILDHAQNHFAAMPEHDHIFEVPLLYETGWHAGYDAVICVWAAPETVRDRLHGRGLNDAEIQRRMKFQMPADEKLAKADFGLINNGPPEQLYQQCKELSKQLKEEIWKNKNS
jgi:dephospho-CoA kinase